MTEAFPGEQGNLVFKAARSGWIGVRDDHLAVPVMKRIGELVRDLEKAKPGGAGGGSKTTSGDALESYGAAMQKELSCTTPTSAVHASVCWGI